MAKLARSRRDSIISAPQTLRSAKPTDRRAPVISVARENQVKVKSRGKKGRLATYNVGEFVFVNDEGGKFLKRRKFDASTQWIGRIDQVLSRETVSVRWMKNPHQDYAREEIDKSHYGKNERILSDDTDPIHAKTINGTVNVLKYHDSEKAVGPEDFYYRQQEHFRFVEEHPTPDPSNGHVTPNLLKEPYLEPDLPKICVEEIPRNPDDQIVKCPACGYAHHRNCVKDKIAKKHLRKRGHWSSLQASTEGSKKVVCFKCKVRVLVLAKD